MEHSTGRYRKPETMVSVRLDCPEMISALFTFVGTLNLLSPAFTQLAACRFIQFQRVNSRHLLLQDIDEICRFILIPPPNPL